MICDWLKDFLFTSIILIFVLVSRLLVFVGLTSTCVGVQVVVSQSYLYFNHVKLSTSLEIFICLAILAVFAFLDIKCTSAAIQNRINQNPFSLIVFPNLLYAGIYTYAVSHMMKEYVEVHSFPVEITNDAMYVVASDAESEKMFQVRQYTLFGIAPKDIKSQNSFVHKFSDDDTETAALIASKNWHTAIFLLNFVYVFYVSCRVVIKDMNKNISDIPYGSSKQVLGFLSLVLIQFLLLGAYMLFFGLGAVAWTQYCNTAKDCLTITICIAILVGAPAGILESGSPWPRKRERNEPINPFHWYENLLRARFAIMLFLFACVNWSFFEPRRGSHVHLKEPTFVIFSVIIGATTIHLSKVFTCILLGQAERIYTTYRALMQETEIIDAANDLENFRPDLPEEPNNVATVQVVNVAETPRNLEQQNADTNNNNNNEGGGSEIIKEIKETDVAKIVNEEAASSVDRSSQTFLQSEVSVGTQAVGNQTTASASPVVIDDNNNYESLHNMIHREVENFVAAVVPYHD